MLEGVLQGNKKGLKEMYYTKGFYISFQRFENFEIKKNLAQIETKTSMYEETECMQNFL